MDPADSGGFCCWYGHSLLPCCWGNACRGAPKSLFLCCFTACSGMNCCCESSTGGCLQLLFMPPPCHSYKHSIKVLLLNYNSLILWTGKLEQCCCLLRVTKLQVGWSEGSNPGSRRENFILQNVATSSGAHPTSYSMDNGSIPQGKSSQCVKLTTHLHLVPRLTLQRRATSISSFCTHHLPCSDKYTCNVQCRVYSLIT
jgi:hypothetical protein